MGRPRKDGTPAKKRAPVVQRTKHLPVPDKEENTGRLTLSVTPKDLEELHAMARGNLRSMSAQAIYYIRMGIAAEKARSQEIMRAEIERLHASQSIQHEKSGRSPSGSKADGGVMSMAK